MKIFGYNMEKNIKYNEGKKILDKFITETNSLYEWLKKTCERYNNSVFELPEFTGFNYEKAVKFINTWDIINELPTEKKNMFLIYCATEFDYEKALEIFNGVGKGCKNVATLRVLITNIRKIIKEKYRNKYGTDKLDFDCFNSSIYC